MPSTIASSPPPIARSARVIGGETYLIGRRGSPHVHEYRDFLERNRVPFRWIDIDRNPLVRHLEAAPALRSRTLPFSLLADGNHLEPSTGPDPDLAFVRTRAELAARVGLHAAPDEGRYDAGMIGAGPAGRAAAG